MDDKYQCTVNKMKLHTRYIIFLDTTNQEMKMLVFGYMYQMHVSVKTYLYLELEIFLFNCSVSTSICVKLHVLSNLKS